jgi:hypothetical protein
MKMEILAKEGVRFDEKGVLVGKECLWDGFDVKSI